MSDDQHRDAGHEGEDRAAALRKDRELDRQGRRPEQEPAQAPVELAGAAASTTIGKTRHQEEAGDRVAIADRVAQRRVGLQQLGWAVADGERDQRGDGDQRSGDRERHEREQHPPPEQRAEPEAEHEGDRVGQHPLGVLDRDVRSRRPQRRGSVQAAIPSRATRQILRRAAQPRRKGREQEQRDQQAEQPDGAWQEGDAEVRSALPREPGEQGRDQAERQQGGAWRDQRRAARAPAPRLRAARDHDPGQPSERNPTMQRKLSGLAVRMAPGRFASERSSEQESRVARVSGGGGGPPALRRDDTRAPAAGAARGGGDDARRHRLRAHGPEDLRGSSRPAGHPGLGRRLGRPQPARDRRVRRSDARRRDGVAVRGQHRRCGEGRPGTAIRRAHATCSTKITAEPVASSNIVAITAEGDSPEEAQRPRQRLRRRGGRGPHRAGARFDRGAAASPRGPAR